jgi:DNA repair protein RecO (recombination protein O)
MLHKTRGIFLRAIDYSDSSLIATIYTEKFGTQSYLLQGVKKNKSKIRPSILQPLHLYDMVVYHKENGGLQRISDCRNTPHFQSIPFDMRKRSIAMFICELLNHTLVEHQEDDALFSFVEQNILTLDDASDSVANAALWFMVHYTKFLGFFPNLTSFTEGNFFDLKNSQFCNNASLNPYTMNESSTALLKEILLADHLCSNGIVANAQHRRDLIDQLILYYQLHIDGFKPLKSHQILAEILQ